MRYCLGRLLKKNYFGIRSRRVKEEKLGKKPSNTADKFDPKLTEVQEKPKRRSKTSARGDTIEEIRSNQLKVLHEGTDPLL